MAICEYYDSNALLSELGDSFFQGFDDALHQVKKTYSDLDVSNIKVEDQAQMSLLPVALNDMDDLFVEVDGLGDRESAPVPPITDSANQPIPEAATQSVIKAAIQLVTKIEQPENISAQT